ncbi:c-type cytochrome [Sedimenticola thiotaurini]|uniref:c-type cytochrome n=1 Tax=Sedimenticola thiotaurini TaxID=1543721 RepID=UPI00069B8731|nr:c-type cytochrome [Sedimenticola thiotaurini]
MPSSRCLYSLICTLFSCLISGTAAAVEPGPVRSEPQQYNLGLGRVIFTTQCIKCHGKPDSGAPQLGAVNDWEERLKRPLPLLISHAINGHGEMPPKGGLDELTEHDISAAVAYVVNRSRRLFVEYGGHSTLLFDKICSEDRQLETCQQSRLHNTLLLQMLWLITGQKKE